VLERDVRQHLHRRAQDVGRVVATAEAGLDRRRLDSGIGELGHGSRGQCLELRGSERLGLGSDPGKHSLDVDLAPADANPLRPAGHVR